MRRLILLLLSVLLLILPVSAATSGVRVTSYAAVCNVSEDGSCDVSLTLSVDFSEDATSFLVLLPPEAENVSVPGLQAYQSSEEDYQLLLVEQADGFSASDVISLSYHLPQLVESFDSKQTMTLPLLYADWNCEITYFQMQVNLPDTFDVKPSIVDADGDTLKNYFTTTTDGTQLTLESSGTAFRPKNANLQMAFPDGYFTLPETVSEDSSDTTQINALDVSCSVLEDSSCSVSMTAEYTFRDNPTVLHIPVPRTARNITVGGLRFSKKVTKDCTVLTVKNSAGFSGTQTVAVTYRLIASAEETDDGQLLTLPLLYSQWDYSIRSFSLALTLPAAYEGLPSFSSSYYNDQIDNYLSIQTEGEQMLVKSLQPLMEQETLTMQLSLPEDYFDLRFRQGLFDTAETLLFWITLVLCVLYWYFFLRFRMRQVVPESRAPLGCNAGQIPYLLQLKKPSFGLTVAAWASLGYITLERTHGKKLKFYRRIDMQNERSRGEMLLFSKLFGKERSCTSRSRGFAEAASHWEELTREDWKSRLVKRRRRRKFGGNAKPLKILAGIVSAVSALTVFDSIMTPQSFRWFLIIPCALFVTPAALQLQKIADLPFARHKVKPLLLLSVLTLALLVLGAVSDCFGIMLLNCLLQFLVGVALLPGAGRSAAGVDLFYQLLGLRKYLKALDVSDLDTMLRRDPQYYYRVLPYAEALGLGKSFTKKFAGITLEPCHWLNWKGMTFDRAEDFYPRFCLLLDEMDSSGTSKPVFSLFHKK